MRVGRRELGSMRVKLLVALSLLSTGASFDVPSYSSPNIGAVENSNEIVCKRGEYLDRSVKKCLQCPAGRYGESYGLKRPLCDGLCHRGHYCPPGSTSSRQQPCGSGRYGSSLGLKDARCDGPCKPGYLCPERSITPTVRPCGEVHHYCPLESGERRDVSLGQYTVGGTEYTRHGQVLCEPGHYCVAGVKFKCPAGRFGNITGLYESTCGGWWTRSVGNAAKEKVTFSGECPTGHYCPIGSVVPTKCPAGRYGGTLALKTPGCSGSCAKGYYCPPASIRANQTACPKGRYGNVTGLQTKACNPNCVDGKYCVGQTEIVATDGNYLLGVGHPGHVELPDDMFDANTKGSMCDPGFYCETGSPSSHQYHCGMSNKFCPSGSFAPTVVSTGYYTVGGFNETTRSSQKECPPGFYCVNGIKIICPKGKYGTDTGLSQSECNGDCDPGYYCDPGSDSQRQFKCGMPSLYCPLGSFAPTSVSEGYYSTQGEPVTRANQSICEPGRYCVGGIKRMCPPGKFGATAGLASAGCSGECFLGHYCPINSTSGKQVECPAGKFGGTRGLRKPYCSGPCSENFYCPNASISSKEIDCPGANYICPVGSPEPIPVPTDETYILDTTRRHAHVCDKDNALHGVCPDKVLATRDPDITLKRETEYMYLDNID
jgi:hypothetical protein